MTGDDRSAETGVPAAPAPSEHTPPPEADFRWQALFQRSSDPVFVLNRRRRILFVNHAWEKLTGLSSTEARGLICQRRAPTPQDPWDVVIRALCCPPQEVLKGKPGRVRRLVPQTGPGDRWWDIEFFPLYADHELLCVLGKIARLAHGEQLSSPPLPEKLVALRESRRQQYTLDQLASRLPAMQRVAEQVRLAGQSGSAVLILGERGTGKQWIARTIHNLSNAREACLVALDCARLPPAALEAALFGRRFAADGHGQGTCYLREPSFLPRDIQLRLCDSLRGANEDGGRRILAGASSSPVEAVQAGSLLEELYCLLSPLTISLPPLRDRQADMDDLVQRFLQRAGSHGERRVPELAAEAWDLFRGYPWPGNLGELYSVLRDACVRAAEGRIEASHLPAALRLAVRLDETPAPVADKPLPLDQILEQAERRLIVLALRKAGGNKSKAAELLSIWRPRLLRRMEALGIADS
jgi:transcriptional regulator with PAS, ATPase and Fis domain